MNDQHRVTFVWTAASFFFLLSVSHASTPLVDESVVFAERDGVVAVEAEHFYKQTATDKRAFHLTTKNQVPSTTPDGDGSHIAGASGGAYLEILPDTRRTHADQLIRGENFSPTPGKLAILHYKVKFNTPGRYYVWVRAHSTGSEDNGLHVGMNGEWPESGQRLQWCQGKRTWRWESKQRTEQEHCGEPHRIFLDVKQPGDHVIHFSMREDGFEFDKWMMTKDRNFERPPAVGPESQVARGEVPPPFEYVAVKKAYPAHWGEPPQIQTRDIRPLPGGYGQGSSTLAKWIQDNLDRDAKETPKLADAVLEMPAKMFELGDSGYYLDRDKWLAVNPDSHKQGQVGRTFPFPTGTYHVTLRAVGESDGKSSYVVRVDDETIGEFLCPLSDQTYEEGSAFEKTWPDVKITEGAIIGVRSKIGSEDGNEFSRARWAAVTFAPADQQTLAAAKPALAEQVAAKKRAKTAAPVAPRTSPTKAVSSEPLILPRKANGDGSVELSGDNMTWHKVTLTLDGPFAHEQDNAPNPFTDYRMSVTFSHPDGTEYTIPGYFAADGDALNTSAQAGTKWRAHFAPDRIGKWNYQVSFHQGPLAALNDSANATALAPFDGQSGSIQIKPSDKQGRDFRARGRLQYVGKHYLRFPETGQYFLKVGADAPETLLAYSDFDNTVAGNPKKAPLKDWSPHLGDWKPGDPTWQGGKGKGLIGAVNYLAGKGCNAFSFLTYNAGGDGDNIWPFIHRDDKLHYDCSKLDQWGVVFDHGTELGMYLHFKMQETENDDHKKGKGGGSVPESLDGGNLGAQRQLYCRELVARFGHNLALNWNLGEENTQTESQQQAMINYIADLDAYGHNIVIHTYPGEQDKVYRPLLGSASKLTGVSLQNSSIKTTHAQTQKWVAASAAAGRPWVVAFDESGTAAHGQCPDLGYQGFDGRDRTGKMIYTPNEVRKYTLWGTLMAGGAGCEYYFGYQFAENDIVCEDWRSRDQSWDYCRIAIEFFHENKIPFWAMQCRDELVGNPKHDNSVYCFAKPNDCYLVYLPNGGSATLNLSKATGDYELLWFNPRTGGELQTGTVKTVAAGSEVSLGNPPTDSDQDWLAVVRKSGNAKE